MEGAIDDEKNGRILRRRIQGKKGKKTNEEIIKKEGQKNGRTE